MSRARRIAESARPVRDAGPPGSARRRSTPGGPRRASVPGAGPRWRRAVGAILLPLVLLPACAYFNTFYYAKRYYRQAEKMVAAAGSDKLPPEAARRYDDSIKQSGKVIKYHGKSRWVDDALYLMGAAYYGKREYEEALRKFDELVTNYPESKFVPWALYRSGLCHYERKNYEQMETYFRRVREGYPKFERRDDLVFIEARAAEDRRERPAAVRRYRELVSAFPKSPRSAEALRRIGDLYFDAGFADSAHASYVEMGRLARDEATFRQAELKVADALVRLGKAPEAIERLRDLLPRDESTAQARQTETWAAEIHVGLARAYNANGEHRRALESLRMVTSAYSSSTFAPEAQFQIGYTYETYMDSLDAARAAYDQAARVGASSVYREQAQQRSRNLQQLQTLRTAAQSDTATGADRAAEAQLRLAELYLLSQNKPEEALRLYRLILEQYPESRVAPRAAYAVSWTLLRRQEGKRDSALAGFVDLVHRYPASTAARGAIDLLVEEGADTTGLGALLVALQPDTAAADTTAAEAPAPATHGPQTSPGIVPPGLAPGSPDTTGARAPADSATAPDRRRPASGDTTGARLLAPGDTSLSRPFAPGDTSRAPAGAPIDSAGGAIPAPPDTAGPSVPAPTDTLPPPGEEEPAPLPGRMP